MIQNLASLQEQHQIKKKSSILYQFLDRRPSLKKSVADFTPTNIFRSMANVLKREQLSEKDAIIYNVERWMDIFSTLIKQRNLFCRL